MLPQKLGDDFKSSKIHQLRSPFQYNWANKLNCGWIQVFAALASDDHTLGHEMATLGSTALSYRDCDAWLVDQRDGSRLQIWSPSIDRLTNTMFGTIRLSDSQSFNIYWSYTNDSENCLYSLGEVSRSITAAASRGLERSEWMTLAASFARSHGMSSSQMSSSQDRVRWPVRPRMGIKLRRDNNDERDQIQLRIWRLEQPPTYDEMQAVETSHHDGQSNSAHPCQRSPPDVVFHFNLEGYAENSSGRSAEPSSSNEASQDLETRTNIVSDSDSEKSLAT
ncbi:hypothetical protein MIND_00999800 [Mycena indigotica]|uniref:Uncharacterized protein n=1 Tax=Mycena indigotica TaxID=2126181 RepID=A0A8H6VUQ2_9AGAR|nr:uncharacterized protein MIND_00999800 [Mycena indigotica]KAF7294632.1 hypothetical protein MIND_00999800 [Mycena indigotica]